MNILSVFLLLILIGAVGGSIYLLWDVMPSDDFSSGSYISNRTHSGYSENSQFYPRMRYIDNNILYEIYPSCSAEKKKEVLKAFGIISNLTILRFYESQPNSKPQIYILCSEIAPETGKEGHFVAGEGGPSRIINTTLYSAIVEGKVSLYRAERCQKPNVALHEILHALGFNHSESRKSIMYTVTECDQTIDSSIIKIINELYSGAPAADLAIEQAMVSTSGRYLDFNITIANYGLIQADSPVLRVSSQEEFTKDFPLEKLELGKKTVLTAKNIRIPKSVSKITFNVFTRQNQNELSFDNNKITVEVQKKSAEN